MLFFQPTIAHSGPTTSRTVTLSFDGSRQFTHIFIKGRTALPEYTISGVAATYITPQFAHGDVYGNRMPNLSDGSYNDLIQINEDKTPLTASSVTLTFMGAVDIEQILILNMVLDFEGREWNSRINYGDVQQVPLGVNKRTATGRLRFVPPLNNTPDAWRIPCDILFDRQRESEFYAYVKFRRDYRSGFVFAVDPTFYPHLIAPVLFEGDTSIGYQARWKRNGRRVRFTVRSV